MKHMARLGEILGKICFIHCSIYLILLLLLTLNSLGTLGVAFPELMGLSDFLRYFDNPWIHIGFASLALIFAFCDICLLAQSKLKPTGSVIGVLIIGILVLLSGLGVELAVTHDHDHHHHARVVAHDHDHGHEHHHHEHDADDHECSSCSGHGHDWVHLGAHLLFMAGNIIIVIGHRLGAHRLHCPNH